MFPVTDTITKKSVFISGDKVVAVFEIQEGDHAGKTGINLLNSSIVADEGILEVVAQVTAGA